MINASKDWKKNTWIDFGKHKNDSNDIKGSSEVLEKVVAAIAVIQIQKKAEMSNAGTSWDAYLIYRWNVER